MLLEDQATLEKKATTLAQIPSEGLRVVRVSGCQLNHRLPWLLPARPPWWTEEQPAG